MAIHFCILHTPTWLTFLPMEMFQMEERMHGGGESKVEATPSLLSRLLHHRSNFIHRVHFYFYSPPFHQLGKCEYYIFQSTTLLYLLPFCSVSFLLRCLKLRVRRFLMRFRRWLLCRRRLLLLEVSLIVLFSLEVAKCGCKQNLQ